MPFFNIENTQLMPYNCRPYDLSLGSFQKYLCFHKPHFHFLIPCENVGGLDALRFGTSPDCIGRFQLSATKTDSHDQKRAS